MVRRKNNIDIVNANNKDSEGRDNEKLKINTIHIFAKWKSIQMELGSMVLCTKQGQ